jgi:hypothetical protein
MIKIFQKIPLFFFTLINILKFYFLNIFERKKIIFFYFPVKAYSENILEINDKIKNSKKFKTYFLYNRNSADIIKKYKNSFFLDFDLVKYIPFNKIFLKKIDIFISSYVNYVFPPNSTNIYICHDIADAPMVNQNIEKKIFLSLNRYNYICLSSDLVVQYYKKKFLSYLGSNIKPKLVNTGYLKLDNVIKKLKKYKSKKQKILIAPTYSLMMNDYNMSDDLVKIIDYLLILKEKVIYRPHPIDLTTRGNLKLIKFIIKNFEKKLNFEIDLSTSYLKSYSDAKLLITDFSGTAYTFSYATLKPAIFFSKNEKKLLKSKNKNLSYFKDRKDIGVICSEVKKLKGIISKIKKKDYSYSKKIYILRKKRIKYLNNSLNKTSELILNLS